MSTVPVLDRTAERLGRGRSEPAGGGGAGRVWTVEDAKRMSPSEVATLYRAHVNPGQVDMMRLVGCDRVGIREARGAVLVDGAGNAILDFWGGFGALALGHNHPRIVEARMRFQRENRHELVMAFLSQYATALAATLAHVAPGNLEVVHLCTSGSEAVEAALKLAEHAQGAQRAGIVYVENSFHGKTKGALSVTDSERFRSDFRLLPHRIRIPFGDAAALERALTADPALGAVILEPIQGGAGIVVAPDGYLRDVRRICDRHRVLWIADEVQSGFGRTGRFFAFEHDGVVPDVVTMAKALGGGKAAVGAAITTREVFERAYGSPARALVHGPSTFSAMGEACCTALEAINVLLDEGLMERAQRIGGELLSGLHVLRGRFPGLIREVRGRGLMVAIEFQDLSGVLPQPLRPLLNPLDGSGALCAAVGTLLLRDHRVLIGFTDYNRNVARLAPPLVVERRQIQALLAALEATLELGVTGILRRFAARTLRPGDPGVGTEPATPHG